MLQSTAVNFLYLFIARFTIFCFQVCVFCIKYNISQMSVARQSLSNRHGCLYHKKTGIKFRSYDLVFRYKIQYLPNVTGKTEFIKSSWLFTS
jgi:hypothetical protein